MRDLFVASVSAALLAVGAALTATQQDQPQTATPQDQPQTGSRPASSSHDEPVITGRQYAVSSMKHQATEAAVRILEAGGNAFEPRSPGKRCSPGRSGANGFGSDAVILVYDAKTKKVSSVNAEGPAPRLATIDWYRQNHDNKLPDSDGLLVGHGPGRHRCLGHMLERGGR